MSIIGNKVEFVYREYDTYKGVLTGTILDKYIGIKKLNDELPSNKKNCIPVEYYLIQTEKELKHVCCDDIRKVL